MQTGRDENKEEENKEDESKKADWVRRFDAAILQQDSVISTLIDEAERHWIDKRVVASSIFLPEAPKDPQNLNALRALIEKASSESISQALLIRDTEGQTAFHEAARNHASLVFRALVEKASSESISQVLLIRSVSGKVGVWGMIAFHVAARNQDALAFRALVEKASSESISQALLKRDTEEGSTALHGAASRQDSLAFRALVEKASSESISKAILIRGDFGYTVFHEAACRQDSLAFRALVEKASSESISQALLIQDNLHRTAFHLSAAHQDSLAFRALVEKASSESINQALLKQDNTGKTVFHGAAAHQDSLAFRALVEKAGPESISKAILIQENGNWNPFQVAARQQDSLAFRALIEKASPESISQELLLKPNNLGFTALLAAARYQDSLAFRALVEKASSESFSQALLVRDDKGRTPVQMAARNQDSAAISALIGKCPLVFKNVRAIPEEIWLANERLTEEEKVRLMRHLEILQSPKTVIRNHPDYLVEFFSFYISNYLHSSNARDWNKLINEILDQLGNVPQESVRDPLLALAAHIHLYEHGGSHVDDKVRNYILQITSPKYLKADQCIMVGDDLMAASRECIEESKKQIELKMKALDFYQAAIEKGVDVNSRLHIEAHVKANIPDSPSFSLKNLDVEEEKEESKVLEITGKNSKEKDIFLKAKQALESKLTYPAVPVLDIFNEFKHYIQDRKSQTRGWFTWWMGDSEADHQIRKEILDDLEAKVKRGYLNNPEGIDELISTIQQHLSDDRLIKASSMQMTVTYLKKIHAELEKLVAKQKIFRPTTAKK